MAYEFKKISNVEVVAEPTESANVLIEENGVIKKAPKTAVGGDAANHIFIKHNLGDQTISCNHTFDEILTMLEDFGTIGVVATGDPTYFSYTYYFCDQISSRDENDMDITTKDQVQYIKLYVAEGIYRIYKDNHIEFESLSEPT